MVLTRIREWLRSLFGTDTDGADADTGATETTEDGETAAYRCAVCGTPVGDPDGECPLCHSTDIVPAAEEADESQSAGVSAGLDPGSATEHSVAADTDAEQRLAAVLGGDGDPLEEYADCWEPDGDGYLVERPDGGTEHAATKTELRAVLGRLYR